jgi:exopolysaccharide production protein ExoQ
MPRQLALLFCTIFVTYLLYKYDRRHLAGNSRVLWLPTLWMLSIASRSLDTWLSVGGGRDSGGVLDPIFQICLLCLGLIILTKRKLVWAAVIRENTWLLILIGYMLISVTWSDIPFASFKRWVREFTAPIMALLVLTEAAPQQAMQSILRRTVYILIPFSVLLVKYFPDLGVMFSRWTGDVQWVGVTLQKNSLGRLCLISLFFLVWTFTRRWRKKDFIVAKYQTQAEILVLMMTLWLFRGPSMWAASATAVYALAVGLITFFILLWTKKHGIQIKASVWVTIAATIIGFGILTPLVGGSTVTGFTSAVGRDATLTGRTDIWASLLPDLGRQPLLGYGFASFWTSLRALQHNIGEAHNGYLEVMLGLGAVGLFLTAMFLLSTIRKSGMLLAHDFDWASLSICFLLMATVHNITESSFDSLTTHLTATVLFLSVSLPAATKHPLVYESVHVSGMKGAFTNAHSSAAFPNQSILL